jgi:hypothetical protein
MPELKSYTDDSPKSGHYILANVGGPHPITIQVTDLGERILRNAGYKGGDNVPTKVVWSMFEVGILYTSGKINDPPEVTDDPGEIFRQLGVENQLTAQEQEQLIRYLNEYTGPNQTEVADLRETLEASTATMQVEQSMPEEVEKDLARLSNLYERGDLKEKEYELLKSRILDNLPSTDTSDRDAGEKANSVAWEDDIRFDIREKFRGIVPESKYDNSFKTVELEDKSTDDIGMVYVSYSPDDGGFSYYCAFHERAHEERMFELLEGDTWELEVDSSDDSTTPSVMVGRKAGQDGFRDELPSGYVDEEISHFVELVQTVYGTDLSALALKS